MSINTIGSQAVRFLLQATTASVEAEHFIAAAIEVDHEAASRAGPRQMDELGCHGGHSSWYKGDWEQALSPLVCTLHPEDSRLNSAVSQCSMSLLCPPPGAHFSNGASMYFDTAGVMIKTSIIGSNPSQVV